MVDGNFQIGGPLGSKPWTYFGAVSLRDQEKLIREHPLPVSGNVFQETIHLNGNFHGNGFGPVSGKFSVKPEEGTLVLFDQSHREIWRSPSIRLTPQEASSFSLFNIIIGNRFHWERREDQTFQGD
jgi:hypothetical protein